MMTIIKIPTLILIPFIFVFGGGGLMLTLTFMLVGFLDNIIIGLISTGIIVYTIVNMIINLINIFIRDIHNTDIYKKRSFWYMYVILFISYFYYTLYEKLKDDYIYY